VKEKKDTQYYPISNYCKSVPGKPFCVNINGDYNPIVIPTYVCGECQHNCDCPINKYCIKTPGVTRGTCANIDANNTILGFPCNNFDPWTLRERPIIPTKGQDENLVCGIPMFDDSGMFLDYEWLGYCKQGKCEACTAYGPDLGQTMALIGLHDQSFLLCPGVQCIGGKLQIPDYAVSNPNIISQVDLPTGIDGSILFFVIVITLSTLTVCICDVKDQCDPRKYKRVSKFRKTTLPME